MYLKLEDATALLFPDGKTHPQTEAEYFAWQVAHLAQRGLARSWYRADLLYARVNQGRWLTTCQYCKKPVYTHPVWRTACCGECGAIYRDVIFPEKREAIEQALLVRPMRESQNWMPHESVFDLIHENMVHEVATL